MKFSHYKGLPRVSIDTGEYYVTGKKEIISTLLGSCVAACLYDEHSRVLGMNHFLLAQQPAGTATGSLNTDEGRYGIQAMELLINGMLKAGAQRQRLKAKVFGGGSVLTKNQDWKIGSSIGAGNCEFIRAFLAVENIPLISSDLGGSKGRNIYFLGTDFSVYVRSIDPRSQDSVIREERQFLDKKRTITATGNLDEVDFW